MINFIYQATLNYEKLNLTLTEIQNSCNHFNDLMREELLVITVNFFYQNQMVEYDFYGAKNFSQAQQNFDLATNCVLNSVDLYLSDLISSKNSTLSSDLVQDYVDKMFSSNKCQPPSP